MSISKYCASKLIFALSALSLTIPCYATTYKYRGVASDSKGQIVYVEEHSVELDKAGDVLKAITIYRSVDGKELASLRSDFSSSLSTPDYVFQNLVDGASNGLRNSAAGAIIFDQKASQLEKTKLIETNSDSKLLRVAGQGLHYYIVKNINEIARTSQTEIELLAPGALDAYHFRMKVVAQDNKSVDLKLEVKNFLLRLFAPSLSLKYSKPEGRLLEYSGISNLPLEDGKLQNVTIRYEY